MEQTQKEVFNLKMRIFPKGKRAMGHFASIAQYRAMQRLEAYNIVILIRFAGGRKIK